MNFNALTIAGLGTQQQSIIHCTGTSTVNGTIRGVVHLTVGVSGRNIFLSTPYRGVDPETNLSGATNSQGADYFNMPNTMGVIFSLKANL